MSTVQVASSDNYKPIVELLFMDAGGGHRASAMALKTVAEQQRRPWQIRMTNLRDLLEQTDFIRRLTGVKVEDVYNRMLRYGLTSIVNPILPMMQTLIRRLHASHVRTLTEHWRESAPDIVISLVPHFNRAIFQGVRASDLDRRRPHTPMATILTDFADYPPHFWIERQEQYYFCGTAMAARQVVAAGNNAECVLRTSGMIVAPEFYRPAEMSRAAERIRLGLSPYLPTGLVMFGGYGSRKMISIARGVAAAGLRTQLIFMCGHNQNLRERLTSMDLPFPHHIVGFSHEIPYFMQLSDYFVGKPGPGSLSEALVMRLPLIVDRNASTMVQERYNTEWIEDNGVGTVLRSFNDIAAGVKAMLDASQHAHFRFKIGSIENRAVFEIPDMIEALIMNRELPAPRHEESSRREQIYKSEQMTEMTSMPRI
jgi:UDP-N-acetylglucosamine:LPS N-acetylglucosamine transferase